MRAWSGAWAAFLMTVALAGCTSAPAQPTGPFPVRPAAIEVMRLDPCRALTAEQLAARGLQDARVERFDPELSAGTSHRCSWRDLSTVDFSYAVQMIPQSAAPAVGTDGAVVGQVAGYGTVRLTEREQASPLCEILVDIADDALMRLQVQAVGVDRSGASPSIDRTCGEADRLAADAITTLRAAS